MVSIFSQKESSSLLIMLFQMMKSLMTSYNSSGSVELGEETFRRIVQNGISTKALYEGESAESRIHQLNGHTIRTDKSTGRAIRAGKINKTPVDDIYGKDYIDDINMQPANRGLVTNLLSTSRLGERFMPALSVKSLKNYAKFKSPIILSASSDTSISDGFRCRKLILKLTLEHLHTNTIWVTYQKKH